MEDRADIFVIATEGSIKWGITKANLFSTPSLLAVHLTPYVWPEFEHKSVLAPQDVPSLDYLVLVAFVKIFKSGQIY
jgi:hypothetical protein